MNWESIGAVGNLVSGVGVIVTLGYLAMQIRQNTRQLRRAEQNVTMEQESSYRRTIMGNPDLARITSEGFMNPAELTPTDRVRARHAMIEIVILDYNLWRRREAGLMHTDEDNWRMHAARIAISVGTPFGREIWAGLGPSVAPSYRRLVDGILAGDQSGGMP